MKRMLGMCLLVACNNRSADTVVASPTEVTAGVRLAQSSAEVLAAELRTALSKQRWAAIELSLAPNFSFTSDGEELGGAEFLASLQKGELTSDLDDSLGACDDGDDRAECYQPGQALRVILAKRGGKWELATVSPP